MGSSSDRKKIADDLISLRRELKAWEKSFRQHFGRDANKDDISARPEMATKYKKYSRLKKKLQEISDGYPSTPERKTPSASNLPNLAPLQTTPSKSTARKVIEYISPHKHPMLTRSPVKRQTPAALNAERMLLSPVKSRGLGEEEVVESTPRKGARGIFAGVGSPTKQPHWPPPVPFSFEKLISASSEKVPFRQHRNLGQVDAESSGDPFASPFSVAKKSAASNSASTSPSTTRIAESQSPQPTTSTNSMLKRTASTMAIGVEETEFLNIGFTITDETGYDPPGAWVAKTEGRGENEEDDFVVPANFHALMRSPTAKRVGSFPVTNFKKRLRFADEELTEQERMEVEKELERLWQEEEMNEEEEEPAMIRKKKPTQKRTARIRILPYIAPEKPAPKLTEPSPSGEDVKMGDAEHGEQKKEAEGQDERSKQGRQKQLQPAAIRDNFRPLKYKQKTWRGWRRKGRL
ncbi:uncharacterized protein VTP21DRAFT_9292 [Calcarisporiella thermophila]|uniref:uncharacterized protein n=1 Tax=Calcarisporiella thermophila TaxID=911321 RepID=UPI003742BFD8